MNHARLQVICDPDFSEILIAEKDERLDMVILGLDLIDEDCVYFRFLTMGLKSLVRLHEHVKACFRDFSNKNLCEIGIAYDLKACVIQPAFN